jgi:uncharacterized RDD family membrane protein YckC
MTDSEPVVTWEAPAEPTGPAPGVEFAPHGSRLVAYILDGFIISVLALVLLVIPAVIMFAPMAEPGQGTDEPVRVMGFLLLMLLTLIFVMAYFPFFWVRGQTPGMKPFGLWVVRDRDGARIGWGSAILRLIGLYIGGTVFYLGYVWILIDKRRRGWHDLIAGTVVVRRQ